MKTELEKLIELEKTLTRMFDSDVRVAMAILEHIRANGTKLLELEKYGTDKNNDKLTYIIIPANHPEFPFPYNLEDRVNYIIEKINDKIRDKIKFKVDKKIENKLPVYTISFNDAPSLVDFQDFIKSFKFTKHGNLWSLIIN